MWIQTVRKVYALALGTIIAITAVALPSELRAQENVSRGRYDSSKQGRDIPDDVKKLIANAKKKTVFEVVGVTTFADQVLKTDKLIFQPGSTLVFSGLRTGDPLVLIAGQVILQDKGLADRIIRDPSFRANDGQPGAPGGKGQPDYIPPHEAFQSRNGGGGGNGGNGAGGESFKAPIVYILVDTMDHPVIPARFVIDFTGVQGGNGGIGGRGGDGGHGDVGYTAQCNWCCCLSGPGKGGDGGPGGIGGQGGPAGPGGPGFDLVLGGTDDFMSIAEQFTLLNKGGGPGLPGRGAAGGGGGGRGRGGQTCGTCNSRGDGNDGPPGGSFGDGAPSSVRGSDGHITFAYGVDVLALLK